MRTYLIFLLCIPLTTSVVYGQLEIQSGATVNISGSGALELNNSGLINDGDFVPGNGTVSLTGNSASLASIEGFGNTAFFNLEINKPSTDVELIGEIMVSNNLTFTNGNLLLIDGLVDLDTSGQLVNESENSRIDGSNGGFLRAVRPVQASQISPFGGIGFSVFGLFNLPEAIVERENYSLDINGQPSINRMYNYMPTSGGGGRFSVSNEVTEFTFNYFDSELNGIEEANLVMVQIDESNNITVLTTLSQDTDTNTITAEGTNISSFITLADANGLSISDYSETENDNLQIYPNPSNNSIDIIFGKDFKLGQQITLVNLLGQIVKIETITTENYQLKHVNLSAGVYVIRWTENSQALGAKKIIWN